MASHPDVVFADEPTGALDTATGQEVLGLLRESAEAGAAVVLVTHDLEAVSMADRAVVLRDGEVHRIMERPSPQEILKVLADGSRVPLTAATDTRSGWHCRICTYSIPTSFEFSSAVTTVVVVLSVAVLASIRGLVRAGRIPPLEALREPEPRAAHIGVARWICVGVLALGVVMLTIALGNLSRNDVSKPVVSAVGLVSGTQFVPVPLRAELRRDHAADGVGLLLVGAAIVSQGAGALRKNTSQMFGE